MSADDLGWPDKDRPGVPRNVWRENIGADIAAAIRARTPTTGEQAEGGAM